jgi:hypothetical protein
MMLLAYPATLGLAGPALRFIAAYVAAGDWSKVIGLLVASSRVAGGGGIAIAAVSIPIVLYCKNYFDPGYAAPMIAALAGLPVVALTALRSEAIRGLGWLGLGWAPLQLGQPLFFLLLAAAIVIITQQISPSAAVGTAILAHAAMLALQSKMLRARTG